ncbi:MAG: SBBP repeat-containing protein [Bacteroidota bacterium]|nr:SBBP repeat-containing protein [Bacteroidota bacterium]
MQWAKKMGSISRDEGIAVAVDSVCNVYTTGYFNHLTDFNPGPGTFNMVSAGGMDIFITKLNSSGNLVWAKRMGGILSDYANAITVDRSGNVYTTGYFYGTADFDPGESTFNMTAGGFNDVFVSKLDSSGNFVWAKQMGGASMDAGISLCIDTDGNLFVAGGFSDSADFNPDTLRIHSFNANGAYDFFIVKLDFSGNFIWARSIGGIDDDYVNSIKTDQSGNLYVVGAFSDVVDFDPGESKHYLTVTGLRDIFVIKLDTVGNLVWVKQISGTEYGGCSSLALDLLGNIIFTGWFSGTTDYDPGPGTFNKTSFGGADIFIAKLDTSGKMIWAKTVGGILNDIGSGVDVDKNGAVYATGYFGDVVDFDPGAAEYQLFGSGEFEIYILKLDSTGNLDWALSLGGPYSDYSRALAVDVSGSVITTGSFVASADFDPGDGVYFLTSTGASDIIVHKMSQGTSGINDYTYNNNINIYPNPNSGIINIDINGIRNNIYVQILNSTGQIVLEENLNSITSALNIQHLTDGLYLIKIISDNSIIATQKIIKQ